MKKIKVGEDKKRSDKLGSERGKKLEDIEDNKKRVSWHVARNPTEM
jgi:hypothetical protein